MELANKIFERMKSLGIKSQTELAEIAGIKRVSLNSYISGRSQPGAEQLSKIAEALKTSMEYLMGITNNPAPITFSEIEIQPIETFKVPFVSWEDLKDDGFNHLEVTKRVEVLKNSYPQDKQFVIICESNSMAPDIQPKDELTVVTDVSVISNNDIVIARVHKLIYLARIKYISKKMLFLYSEKSEPTAFDINDVKVYGRIVGVAREM